MCLIPFDAFTSFLVHQDPCRPLRIRPHTHLSCLCPHRASTFDVVLFLDSVLRFTSARSFSLCPLYPVSVSLLSSLARRSIVLVSCRISLYRHCAVFVVKSNGLPLSSLTFCEHRLAVRRHRLGSSISAAYALYHPELMCVCLLRHRHRGGQFLPK